MDKIDQTLMNDAERIKLAETLSETANVTSETHEKKVLFTRK